MVDLQSILAEHRSKKKAGSSHDKGGGGLVHDPTSSEIPDVFFDKIIVDYKLSRLRYLFLCISIVEFGVFQTCTTLMEFPK